MCGERDCATAAPLVPQNSLQLTPARDEHLAGVASDGHSATLKQDALADSRIMDAVRDDKVVYAAAQQLFERQLQSARELGHRV